MTTSLTDLAEAVGASVQARSQRVAAAESVSAGTIATALASAPEASDWFAGSLVAYTVDVKRSVLGVTAGKIASAECARQMAAGVRRLTGAEIAVAVTGVGGPDPEEGEPAGTVFICVDLGDRVQEFAHRFDGEPEDVVQQSAEHALRHLAELTSGA